MTSNASSLKLDVVEQDETYGALLTDFVQYRLRGKQYGIVVANETDLELLRNHYSLPGRVRVFVHESIDASERETESTLFSTPQNLRDSVRTFAIDVLVVCNTRLDAPCIALITDLNGLDLGCELMTHTDVVVDFDLLYGTFFGVHMPSKFDRVGLLRSFMSEKKSGSMKFLDHVDIEGKTVIELGSAVCGMTAQLVKFSPKKLLVIEAQMSNFSAFNAYKKALNVENAEILLQDFHNLNVKADVLIAYGVLYHSAHPAAFVENLSRVANVICVGAHVWGDDENVERTILHWKGHEIEAQVAQEFKLSTGGLSPHQTYLKTDDYRRIFDTLGFDWIDLGERELPAGRRYAEWVAIRRRWLCTIKQIGTFLGLRLRHG